ncbi:MAG: right-handed parallel beta-helix repeat-containing protein, partial [Planctomycetota bacterium]
AILNATVGDRVARIPRGRYVGDFGIKVSDRSGLTIECEPGTEILVRSRHSFVLLIEHSERVTVRGGLWRHVEPLEHYECHGPVVAVNDCDSVRIEDAVLDGCGAIGVSAGNTSDTTVERCLVTNNTFTAFYLESCDGFEIFDSIIRDNGGFISAYRTSGLELSGNAIGNNGGHFRTPGEPGPGRTRTPTRSGSTRSINEKTPALPRASTMVDRAVSSVRRPPAPAAARGGSVWTVLRLPTRVGSPRPAGSASQTAARPAATRRS